MSNNNFEVQCLDSTLYYDITRWHPHGKDDEEGMKSYISIWEHSRDGDKHSRRVVCVSTFNKRWVDDWFKAIQKRNTPERKISKCNEFAEVAERYCKKAGYPQGYYKTADDVPEGKEQMEKKPKIDIEVPPLKDADDKRATYEALSWFDFEVPEIPPESEGGGGGKSDGDGSPTAGEFAKAAMADGGGQGAGGKRKGKKHKVIGDFEQTYEEIIDEETGKLLGLRKKE